MRNAFGNIFRIALAGESHSPLMSVEINGVPEGIPLSPGDFAEDIDRRRPGRKGTTARTERDIPEIIRGVEDGLTTGTTLKLLFRNENTDPSAYRQFTDIPRPGHADWVRRIKYGADSLTSGGGMFSGRMTLPLVAAGVVAKKIIAPIQVNAREVGGMPLAGNDGDNAALDALLSEVAAEGDSVGGVVECVCSGVPAGLGEPFFYPMEAAISQMIFSIPGIRGIEFGTNGNPIIFRAAVKPTSSIARSQTTVNLATGRQEELIIKGRHDVCFALRVPVVVESAAAIVLCDALLSNA